MRDFTFLFLNRISLFWGGTVLFKPFIFFSSIYFSLKNNKTNPKRTTEAAPVKVLKVSLTFGHLKCLNSGLCLVALSGYSHELSQIWPALQAAQELQGRTSKGPVEWRFRHTGGRDLQYLFSVISSFRMKVLLFASPVCSLIFYLLEGEILIIVLLS